MQIGWFRDECLLLVYIFIYMNFFRETLLSFSPSSLARLPPSHAALVTAAARRRRAQLTDRLPRATFSLVRRFSSPLVARVAAALLCARS